MSENTSRDAHMSKLTYGSVCSGAGTCALAFIPLGVKASWFCEIDPAASAVLAHHWPEVPNLGDMTTLPERIRSGSVHAPDILMGGTPCQAFSVAGKRNSLDDHRGNLTLIFVEIADAIDDVRRTRGQPPVVILWENVPGVLSVKDNAFGCFLGGLAGSGAAIDPGDRNWSHAGLVSGPSRSACWRILDAQYFDVAQRRCRVVVVASAGAFRPFEVLTEREGVRRDFAPSRGTREENTVDVAPSLRARGNSSHQPDTEAFVAVYGCDLSQKAGGQGFRLDQIPTLASGTHPGHGSHVVCVMGDAHENERILSFPAQMSGQIRTSEDVSIILSVTQQVAITHLDKNKRIMVRRLTPKECERLQGWPDDHTLVPYRGKPMQDGPRYKIIGNGWTLPVFAWVGKKLVDEMTKQTRTMTMEPL